MLEAAEDDKAALGELTERLSLSETQGKAVLDMPLRRLTR